MYSGYESSLFNAQMRGHVNRVNGRGIQEYATLFAFEAAADESRYLKLPRTVLRETTTNTILDVTGDPPPSGSGIHVWNPFKPMPGLNSPATV